MKLVQVEYLPDHPKKAWIEGGVLHGWLPLEIDPTEKSVALRLKALMADIPITYDDCNVEMAVGHIGDRIVLIPVAYVPHGRIIMEAPLE